MMYAQTQYRLRQAEDVEHELRFRRVMYENGLITAEELVKLEEELAELRRKARVTA